MHTMDIEKIKKSIDFVTSNEDKIKKAKMAACYYCCEVYSVNEVTEFLEDEKTAFCPKCGVDSVLPDNAGYDFDQQTLIELHNYWFEKTASLDNFVKHFCPICGFYLGFQAWNEDGSPSEEICPCCGIQYGYSDAAGGDIEKRKQLYLDKREEWIRGGYKWGSSNLPRKNWDGEKQLDYYLNGVVNHK